MNQRCPVVSKPIQVNLRNRELSFILFEEKSRVLPKPAQLPLSKYQRNRILILRSNQIWVNIFYNIKSFILYNNKCNMKFLKKANVKTLVFSRILLDI